MLVTLTAFQPARDSFRRFWQFENIAVMSVTADTSKWDRSSSSSGQPANMRVISVTFDVLKEDRSRVVSFALPQP